MTALERILRGPGRWVEEAWHPFHSSLCRDGLRAGRCTAGESYRGVTRAVDVEYLPRRMRVRQVRGDSIHNSARVGFTVISPVTQYSLETDVTFLQYFLTVVRCGVFCVEFLAGVPPG